MIYQWRKVHSVAFDMNSVALEPCVGINWHQCWMLLSLDATPNILIRRHSFEPYIVLSRMPHHGWFQLVSIFGNSKVISTPTTRENHELQIRIEEYRRWERQSEFHDWWIHDSLLTIKHSYCTSTYKTVSFFTLFFRSAFHSPKWN